MTLALHQKGLFTWAEWARALAAQIAAAHSLGCSKFWRLLAQGEVRFEAYGDDAPGQWTN